jgi:shikimate kinase
MKPDPTHHGTAGCANVLLIGLRGSGKSTLGVALAHAVGRAFVDLDNLTPVLMGHASVAEAWKAEGEGAFRMAEAEALTRVLRKDGQIIALGGGTPTAPGASEAIGEARRAGRAIVLYLRADTRTLSARLKDADNRNRPALSGSDPADKQEIDALLAARDGLYLSLADHVVEVGASTEADLCAELARLARGET